MRAAFYLCRGRDFGNEILRRAYHFYPGEKLLLNLGEFVVDADIHVTWGIFKEYNQMTTPIREIEACGKPHVVIEMGYVKRGWDENSYYSFGVGGLNGRAEFFNQDSPRDRREALKVPLRHWRSGAGIMVAGQVVRDASVQHHDHAEWIRDLLSRFPEAIYREHPLQGGTVKGTEKAEKCTCSNIVQAANNHDIGKLITFNSNTAVEAIINGIPTVTMDEGSMAWDITSHIPGKDPLCPTLARDQWFNNLAYTQWRPDEFGERWEIVLKHLKSTQ